MEVKKKKLTVPHVYILLLMIILICGLLSYVIPAGTYQLQTVTTNGVRTHTIGWTISGDAVRDGPIRR